MKFVFFRFRRAEKTDSVHEGADGGNDPIGLIFGLEPRLFRAPTIAAQKEFNAKWPF